MNWHSRYRAMKKGMKGEDNLTMEDSTLLCQIDEELTKDMKKWY